MNTPTSPSPFLVEVELCGPIHLDGYSWLLPINDVEEKLTYADRYGFHLFQRRSGNSWEYRFDYVGTAPGLEAHNG